EAGKRADLMVLDGAPADPYGAFFTTPETAVTFVLINGVPRFGTSDLFQHVGLTGETVKLDGQVRRLNLAPTSAGADPVVHSVSFAHARDTLTQSLEDLPNLANAAPRAIPFGVGAPTQWFLALDELAPTGVDLRPNLPIDGQRSAPAMLGVMPLAAPV